MLGDADTETESGLSDLFSLPRSRSPSTPTIVTQSLPRALSSILLSPEQEQPPDLGFSTYGIYSKSGFDLVGLLARVTTRPNPRVSIGPIDLGCSFCITDALTPDNKIVYVSETFEK